MTSQEVEAYLRRLTPSDWSSMKSKVDAWHALGGQGSAPSEGSAGDPLVDAVHATFQQMGLGQFDYAIVRRLARTEAKQRQVLERYLQESRLSKGQQRGLLQLGVELLVRNLQMIGIPVSLRMVFRNLHRVPAVIDAAFPGYARAGMLGWVIRTREVQQNVVTHRSSTASTAHRAVGKGS